MSENRTMPGADLILLTARLLIALLFIIFGWQKIADFSGTIGYMAHSDLPMPTLAAVVAVVMELFVGIAIAIGAWTRPLALLLAVYTLATAFIAHNYWTMTGSAGFEAEINFYKNISIIGGLLALFAVGAGRYALDEILQSKAGARVRK